MAVSSSSARVVSQFFLWLCRLYWWHIWSFYCTFSSHTKIIWKLHTSRVFPTQQGDILTYFMHSEHLSPLNSVHVRPSEWSDIQTYTPLLQKLQAQSVSPGGGTFYRNQLRRYTTSVVFTCRSVWPTVTWQQWQQCAGHCAQLSLHSVAQTVDTNTKTVHVNLLLVIRTADWLIAARGHCQWTACSGQAVCRQTASPDKGQINIGITDYSQRTSPRR